MRIRSHLSHPLCLIAFVLLLVMPVMGCEPGNTEKQGGDAEITTPPGWRTLISFDEWLPIPSFPPLDEVGSVQCAEGAAQVEENALEVNSTYCSFALFDSPLPEDIPPGASLRWRHWHLELWAAEEAIGTVELYVGEERWYQIEYVIPGPADFEEVTFPITEAIPQGTRLTLHFRNHGLNSWRFGGVDILDDGL